MDDEVPKDGKPKIHAAEAIFVPPFMFLIGYGGTKLYAWFAATGVEGWRVPAAFGFGIAACGLCGIMDNAAPKSVRELRVITACLLFYGCAVVWFFTLTSKQGPSPWTALLLTLLVVIVAYRFYRRTLNTYRGRLVAAFQAQQRPGVWASIEVRQVEVWAVGREVRHDIPHGGLGHVRERA